MKMTLALTFLAAAFNANCACLQRNESGVFTQINIESWTSASYDFIMPYDYFNIYKVDNSGICKSSSTCEVQIPDIFYVTPIHAGGFQMQWLRQAGTGWTTKSTPMLSELSFNGYKYLRGADALNIYYVFDGGIIDKTNRECKNAGKDCHRFIVEIFPLGTNPAMYPTIEQGTIKPKSCTNPKAQPGSGNGIIPPNVKP